MKSVFQAQRELDHPPRIRDAAVRAESGVGGNELRGSNEKASVRVISQHPRTVPAGSRQWLNLGKTTAVRRGRDAAFCGAVVTALIA